MSTSSATSTTLWTRNLFLLIITLNLGNGLGLRLLSVRMPAVAVYGQSVQLECRYILENDDVLYAVKWYKDSDEFYRYVLAERYPVSVFPLPGITVNMSESTDSGVTLSSVSLDTSATFRCEVSAEAPSFQTVHGHANMTVIRPPDSWPLIEGLKEDYSVGEELDVNCTSEPSQPVTGPQLRLNWHLNKRPVVSPVGTRLSQTNDERFLWSNLRVRLTRENFDHDGRLLVGCTSSFSSAFQRSSHATASLRWKNAYQDEQFPIQQLRGHERPASYASGSTGGSGAVLQLLVLCFAAQLAIY